MPVLPLTSIWTIPASLPECCAIRIAYITHPAKISTQNVTVLCKLSRFWTLFPYPSTFTMSRVTKMTKCRLTISPLQLKPTCELILLLPMQDLILSATQSVLYLMHPYANFSLVLGPSQAAYPRKYDTLLSIFHSVNTSSNPVPGPSVTILTGTHWDLIYLPIPNTCTSPSSLLTVYSPQAKLSTDETLWRVHTVRHVARLNPMNIFCAVPIHQDFILPFN